MPSALRDDCRDSCMALPLGQQAVRYSGRQTQEPVAVRFPQRLGLQLRYCVCNFPKPYKATHLESKVFYHMGSINIYIFCFILLIVRRLQC